MSSSPHHALQKRTFFLKRSGNEWSSPEDVKNWNLANWGILINSLNACFPEAKFTISYNLKYIGQHSCRPFRGVVWLTLLSGALTGYSFNSFRAGRGTCKWPLKFSVICSFYLFFFFRLELDNKATLSDHILNAVLGLLKKEVPEHGRHLQQYFNFFLMYSTIGPPEVCILHWTVFYNIH